LLGMRSGASGQRFVIQLGGPMTPAHRQRIAAAGITLGDYLPVNAYVVTLDRADANAVEQLDFVRWGRPYQTSWKLSPNIGRRTEPLRTPERQAIAARGEFLVNICLFRDADADDALRAVRAMRGITVFDRVLLGEQTVIVAALRRADLGRVAGLQDVQYIEECLEPTERNNTVRNIVQSGTTTQAPLYDHGLHGEGQIIGIIDTFVDIDHCSFADVPNDPGPNHRKVLAYNAALGSAYHGTHVAGTAVGDGGTASNTRGVAYLARMVYGGPIPNFSSTELTDRLQFSHYYGARIHCNSWGDDSSTEYTTLSRQIDVFSRDNEEDLIVFAISNASTVRVPENAKSVLAVAASGDNAQINDHCYGGAGPTADGRRKPEVCAPGCGTFSSKWDTACDVEQRWGTSMACPAVGGTAALIRQYLTDGYYPTGVAGENEPVPPSGALLRAMVVNGSVDMTGVAGYPSDLEGWGRLLADEVLHFPGEARTLIVRDVRNASAAALSTGEQWSYLFDVTGSTEQLRVTMAFTDVPATVGAAYVPVNDIDLQVTAPDETVYYGNVFVAGSSWPGGSPDPENCVEQVHVNSPPIGEWTVTVNGSAVNQETQGFALVITGEVVEGPCPGDLNHNGVRNVTDFSIFAAAFGTSIGDPDYNPDADLDGNGSVNVTDFTAFAAVFGVPCP
jgi:hypothetical protein